MKFQLLLLSLFTGISADRNIKNDHIVWSADGKASLWAGVFYDKRTLALSHNSNKKVNFRIEADPVGTELCMNYKTVSVEPGETMIELFPEFFQERWIRLVPESDCIATALFKYE